jgi:hypothetical protein
MRQAADTFLWVLWNVTAVTMVGGALYIFVVDSSLVPRDTSHTKVSLSVDSHLGTTYVSGSLDTLTPCTRVSLKTDMVNEASAILAFQTQTEQSCGNDREHAVTFVSSFPGRPDHFDMTVDGHPIETVIRSL